MTLALIVFIASIIEFNLAGISGLFGTIDEAVRRDTGSKYRDKKDGKVCRRFFTSIVLFIIAISISAACLTS